MASLTHVCMWSDKGLEANFGGTSRKITILEDSVCSQRLVYV